MMEPVTFAMLAVLSALAIVLVRSDVERHLGVFFIIRSGYGIKLIDDVAKLKPRLWEFLADFSVLLSFGGIGAFYLSSNRQTRDNLYKAVLLAGVLFSALALFSGEAAVAAAFLALSACLSYIMRTVGRPHLDFALAAVLSGLACAVFLSAYSVDVSIVTPVSFLCGLFGLPAMMIYLMFTHGLNILAAKTSLPGVSPMLPSEKNGNVGVAFPGYDLFIPWWHLLAALFITMAAHEGAHGVLIRTAGMRLKSTGILSMLSLPIGAFVEPDEEELKRKTSVDRMRVFTVGSFANLVVGVLASLAVLALLNVFSVIVYSDGMRVVGLIDGMPAKDVIPVDTVIYYLNGKPVADVESFRNITAGLGPGGLVELNTSNGAYSLNLVGNDEEPPRGILGVYLAPDLKVGGAAGAFINVQTMAFLIDMLGWVVFFNVNIALVNLLPLIPFDGGRMFKEVVETMNLSENNIKKVLWGTMAAMGALFIVNMLPLLRMGLSLLGLQI